jgi:hypothetical protein
MCVCVQRTSAGRCSQPCACRVVVALRVSSLCRVRPRWRGRGAGGVFGHPSAVRGAALSSLRQGGTVGAAAARRARPCTCSSPSNWCMPGCTCHRCPHCVHPVVGSCVARRQLGVYLLRESHGTPGPSSVRVSYLPMAFSPELQALGAATVEAMLRAAVRGVARVGSPACPRAPVPFRAAKTTTVGARCCDRSALCSVACSAPLVTASAAARLCAEGGCRCPGR